MAWETGTAANHVDLFNKIRDFLTTNTDLVNAGENWTQVLGPSGTLVHGDQITLKGPGLTGTDAVYCGMETLENPGADTYNIRFWGHSGFSVNLEPRLQPLLSPDQYVLLWDQPMTYWIIGNGRRWMLVVKVSTVYSSAYCGFFLPYASPTEYPYPMMVAGISPGDQRWSSQDQRNRFMASPGYNTMFVYYPDNVWRRVANYQNDSNTPSPIYGNSVVASAYMFPTRDYSAAPGIRAVNSEVTTDQMTKCFDGSYIMRDLTIMGSGAGNSGPYDAMIGVLDGVFWVPGRENSSENTISRIRWITWLFRTYTVLVSETTWQ